MDRLQSCNDRVNSKEQTTETCYEEILDFYHCMDHCAGNNFRNCQVIWLLNYVKTFICGII